MIAEDEQNHGVPMLGLPLRPVPPHVQGAKAIGERRLLLAILEDAIRCFQTYLFARENRGRTLFREAEEWLASDDRDPLFSFVNVCEVLGINPLYVRRSLHRWREQQVQAR